MENRRWFASIFMLVILVGLIAYLTFIPVPEANRGIIITVLGVLLGAASSAIPNLFGNVDKEKEELIAELNSLKQEIKVLSVKYETLSDQHDKITRMLVERHVIHGDGIAYEAGK